MMKPPEAIRAVRLRSVRAAVLGTVRKGGDDGAPDERSNVLQASARVAMRVATDRRRRQDLREGGGVAIAAEDERQEV